MPLSVAISNSASFGISPAAVRSSAVLYEPLRRLPVIPMIFIMMSHCYVDKPENRLFATALCSTGVLRVADAARNTLKHLLLFTSRIIIFSPFIHRIQDSFK